MLDHLIQKWHHHFGPRLPEVIVRAPGRVNIIGEHTDYNEGWVLPGAMSLSVYILVSQNEKNSHHWVADNLHEEYQHDRLSQPTDMPLWAKYIEGTMRLYNGDTSPMKILVGGDLPVGAGVSSSSSLVCGLLFALQQLSGGKETKEELALTGSRVEREIIGLQGGIMDQFAIMLSREHHVMMLDCRTRKYEFFSADLPGCRWLLINTKVKHQLIDSDYNNRADQCKKAVSIIQKKYPAVQSLRDVTMDMLYTVELQDVLKKRCIFILEENHRVHAMIKALKNQDAVYAGLLLKASHEGLRYQYEVSCQELDHVADFANSHDGVYGARMMGGGFGGCVICLLKEQSLPQFIHEAEFSYAKRFGFAPEAIRFELGSGAEYLKN